MAAERHDIEKTTADGTDPTILTTTSVDTTQAEADEITTKTNTKTKTMTPGPGGWRELTSADDDRVNNKKNSSEEIELEENETQVLDSNMAPVDDEKAVTEAHRMAGGGGGENGQADGTPAPNAGDANANGGADAAGYKVYKRRWFGLVQLTLLNIIVSWDWLTFSPVSNHSAVFFGTDEANINWLSTAFMFAFCFITPVVIYVLHFGPRPSIITAAVLVLVGNWLRYAGVRATDGGLFGLVMFGQILTGLAQPFVLSAPTRYSDLWFTNRGRVAATALMSLANPFGAALGQLIVPMWVNGPSDIPNMVLYVSIISTVCSVPSFFVPAKPPTPVAPSSETPKLTLKESIKILTAHVEFWLIFIPFSVYVGFFNSISSLLNQIMEPYGYTSDQAGIAGALLIVVGLVSSAITSPILDRTKGFLTAIKIAVPLIGLSYLTFYWMPPTGPELAGPYVVLSIVGAASFSLVPVAVEYLVELTHPISPEVTSTLAWGGGQLLGGIFIIIQNALKTGADTTPPFHMQQGLIFSAVVAMAVVPLPLCLGLFGRHENVVLRRVRSDDNDGTERRSSATFV